MSSISKPFTFSAGATIIASEHNNNYDTIYNDYNGNITNVNIAGNAAIAESKLDLSTISQTITNIDIDGGNIDGTTIGGTTPAAGTFTDLEATGTFKLGSTNQGDILYDNGTSIVRLVPGTSGEVLTTGGAAANPAWGGAGVSNVIFTWSGVDNFNASATGFYTGTTTALGSGSLSANLSLALLACDTSAAATVLNFQFTKLSSINTVTIHARIFSSDADAGREAILTVDIGGQSNTVKSVTSTTASWVTTSTIDVSGLADATTFDGIVQLNNEENNGATAFCSAVTLIGR